MAYFEKDSKERLMNDGLEGVEHIIKTGEDVLVTQEDEPKQLQTNNKKAVLMMCFGMLCLSTGQAMQRIIINEKLVNPFHYLLFIGLLITIVRTTIRQIGKCRGKTEEKKEEEVEVDFDRRTGTIIFLRGAFVLIVTLLMLAANSMIPLTTVQCIQNIGPLAGLVIAYYLVGEPSTCFEISCLTVNLAAISTLVIFAPSEDDLYEEDGLAQPRFGSYVLGVCLVCIAMPMSAFNKVAVRSIQHVDTDVIFKKQFKYVLPIFMVVVLVYVIFAWSEAIKLFQYSFTQYCWMSIGPIPQLMGVKMQISAFKNGKAAFVSCFNCTIIIYLVLFDYFLFGVVITTLQYVCMAVMITSISLVGYKNLKDGTYKEV